MARIRKSRLNLTPAPERKYRSFDWAKAAIILRDEKPQIARAYISGQRIYTGGVIWKNGKPVCNTYTYLQSPDADPVLEYNDIVVPCFIDPKITPEEFCVRYDKNDAFRVISRWTGIVKWPQSAVELLGIEFDARHIVNTFGDGCRSIPQKEWLHKRDSVTNAVTNICPVCGFTFVNTAFFDPPGCVECGQPMIEKWIYSKGD